MRVREDRGGSSAAPEPGEHDPPHTPEKPGAPNSTAMPSGAGSRDASCPAARSALPVPPSRPTASGNPWNIFQHRMGGAGMSGDMIRSLYDEQRRMTTEGPQAGAPPSSRGSTVADSDRIHLQEGYLLIRTPRRVQHLRGIHHVKWIELMRRLQIAPSQWKQHRGQYYLVRTDRAGDLVELWVREGLPLPIPEHR